MTSEKKIDNDQLIECVRRFPVLYDLNRMSHNDRIDKDNAWKCIAATLSRSAEECKSRWRTIRDSYKKNNKKKLSGSAALGKSKYNCDNLRFLDMDRQDERELGDGGLNLIPTIFSTPLIYSNASLALSSQCSVEYGTQQSNSGSGSTNEEEYDEYHDEKVILITKEEIVASLVGGSESTDVATSSQNTESKRSGGDEAPEKKRRKTVVSAKEKNLSEISKPRAERLLIPKHITDDKKPSDEDNPIFTFFKSMAQSVILLPPNIIAETKIRTCQLVAEMEMKAMSQRNGQV